MDSTIQAVVNPVCYRVTYDILQADIRLITIDADTPSEKMYWTVSWLNHSIVSNLDHDVIESLYKINYPDSESAIQYVKSFMKKVHDYINARDEIHANLLTKLKQIEF
jgi:hypothetical protein